MRIFIPPKDNVPYVVIDARLRRDAVYNLRTLKEYFDNNRLSREEEAFWIVDTIQNILDTGVFTVLKRDLVSQEIAKKEIVTVKDVINSLDSTNILKLPYFKKLREILKEDLSLEKSLAPNDPKGLMRLKYYYVKTSLEEEGLEIKLFDRREMLVEPLEYIGVAPEDVLVSQKRHLKAAYNWEFEGENGRPVKLAAKEKWISLSADGAYKAFEKVKVSSNCDISNENKGKSL